MFKKFFSFFVLMLMGCLLIGCEKQEQTVTFNAYYKNELYYTNEFEIGTTIDLNRFVPVEGRNYNWYKDSACSILIENTKFEIIKDTDVYVELNKNENNNDNNNNNEEKTPDDELKIPEGAMTQDEIENLFTNKELLNQKVASEGTYCSVMADGNYNDSNYSNEIIEFFNSAYLYNKEKDIIKETASYNDLTFAELVLDGNDLSYYKQVIVTSTDNKKIYDIKLKTDYSTTSAIFNLNEKSLEVKYENYYTIKYEQKEDNNYNEFNEAIKTYEGLKFICPSEEILNSIKDEYFLIVVLEDSSMKVSQMTNYSKLKKDANINTYFINLCDYLEELESWKIENYPTYFIMNHKNNESVKIKNNVGFKTARELYLEIEEFRNPNGSPTTPPSIIIPPAVEPEPTPEPTPDVPNVPTPEPTPEPQEPEMKFLNNLNLNINSISNLIKSSSFTKDFSTSDKLEITTINFNLDYNFSENYSLKGANFDLTYSFTENGSSTAKYVKEYKNLIFGSVNNTNANASINSSGTGTATLIFEGVTYHGTVTVSSLTNAIYEYPDGNAVYTYDKNSKVTIDFGNAGKITFNQKINIVWAYDSNAKEEKYWVYKNKKASIDNFNLENFGKNKYKFFANNAYKKELNQSTADKETHNSYKSYRTYEKGEYPAVIGEGFTFLKDCSYFASVEGNTFFNFYVLYK